MRTPHQCSTMGKAQSRLPQEAMEKALKYFEAHEVSEIIEIFNRLQADKNNNNADSNGETSKTGESGSTHAGIDIDTFGRILLLSRGVAEPDIQSI